VQALNQKNTERAETYGSQFEHQMAVFLSHYGNDASAKAFITDAQVPMAERAPLLIIGEKLINDLMSFISVR
jgi:hypothetical protein